MKKKWKGLLALFFGFVLCTCIPMNVSATVLEQENTGAEEPVEDHDSEIALTAEDQEPDVSRAAVNSRSGGGFSDSIRYGRYTADLPGCIKAVSGFGCRKDFVCSMVPSERPG